VGAAASERVFYQSFESGSLPEVQGEWESDSPRGLGSPPDPNVGFEGLRVLGNDLTGKGVVPGNYETSVRSEFEVASLDLSRYDGASVSFARWLNVGAGDSAAFEVWRPEGPTVWQYETVFSSTDADDSSWKLESFDISDFAGGRNPILFKFRIDSDSQETASGWNIDAFEVRGVLPVSCAPYMPTLPGEASNLRVGKGTPGQLTLEWNADCGAATTYGIYRGDLRVGYSSISQEPGKCDVTGTTTTVPLGSGQAQFFLVAPHSNGKEGSYGQGTSGLPRPPAAGACYPQGAVAACVP
jgi:hypothetical protein